MGVLILLLLLFIYFGLGATVLMIGVKTTTVPVSHIRYTPTLVGHRLATLILLSGRPFRRRRRR